MALVVVDLGKVGHGPAGATSYYDRGLEESMPWYAQREDLPDTHKQHADAGSELERVYKRLRYVEVPAPGVGEPEELTVLEPEDPPAELEPAPVDEVEPVAAAPASRKRKAAES